MNIISIFLICLSLFIAGLIGITLSIVPQTPAVIVAGLAAITASISITRQHTTGSAYLRCHKFEYGWLAVFMVLSICYFVVRALLSPVLDLGIDDLMLIIPAGILYLLAGYGLTGRNSVRLRLGLTWVVVFLLMLHVVAGFLQIKGGDGFSVIFHFLGATRASQGHVTGMYGYYGDFANFAVIAGLLSLSLGIWGRFAFPVRSFIFVLGIISMCLAVLSQSRSGIVSMFPGLGVFTMLLILSLKHQNPQIKKRVSGMIGGIMSVAFIGIIIAAYWVIQSRGGGDFEGGFNSIFSSVARLNFWPMAYEQWLDFPVIGAGARSFSYLCLLYWNPNLTPTHANPEFVHNEYLQLLADYGLVGFLIVIIALTVHCFIGWSQTRKLAIALKGDGLRKGSNAMALTIAGMSGMVAMSAHICFDFRTHLLANLLLFICCAVWVLPICRLSRHSTSEGEVNSRPPYFQSYLVVLCLLLLGLAGVGIGGQQLWAGIPLLEQRALKEDGAWKPHQVNRSSMIPVLEESLMRAPRWQRFKRLGILYKIEADEAERPEEKEKFYDLAESACLASIELNQYDPIPRINLAAIYICQMRYLEADHTYAATSQMVEAREPWLKMYSQWASLRHRMATLSVAEGDSEVAEIHFQKAIDLFELSDEKGVRMWKNNWERAYTSCLLAYAIFLDGQLRFEETQNIYTRIEEVKKGAHQLGEIGYYYYRGLHYYSYSLQSWRKGEAKKAYRLMIEAKDSMQEARRYSKSSEFTLIDRQTKQMLGFIQFFETTGITK